MTQALKIIACIPADRRIIRELHAQLPPHVAEFKPTVEHSLIECEACQRQVWIGPKQLQVHQSVFLLSKILCAICVAHPAQMMDMEMVALNQEIDQVQPRY